MPDSSVSQRRPARRPWVPVGGWLIGVAVVVVGAAAEGGDPVPVGGWGGDKWPVTVPAGVKPRPGIKRQAVQYGPADGQTYLTQGARWEAGGVEYAVTVAAYPEAFGGVPAAVLLAGVRDGLVGGTGLGGKLIDGHDLAAESGVTAAAEYRVQAGRTHIRARAFVAGLTLYQVTVVGPAAGVGGPAATRFLESFKLAE